MAIQVEVEWEGAGAFSRNMRGGREVVLANRNRALRQIGSVFLPILRRETPVRTGKLRRGSRFQVKGQAEDMRLEVRQGARTASGAFYGLFVREGTRAHEIRPVRARALRFVMDGQVVFARHVQHPGTRPNPYHHRALNLARPAIDAILRGAGARITKVLARLRR